MHMAIKAGEWTRADLEALPDDGNKYEVVRGELFVTPVPRPKHEALIMALAERLVPFVRSQQLGKVHQGRSAMVFEESEVEPDMMILAAFASPPPERWDDVPTPLLVVEVLSRTTQRRDLKHKRELYLDAGVPEYWVIDGERREIRRIRPGHEDETFAEGALLRWSPGVATETFVLDVEEYFSDVLGPALRD